MKTKKMRMGRRRRFDTARTDGVDTARLDGTLTPRGTHVLLTRAEEKQYKWAIRRSDFKVNERLGAGAYGEVWAGSWRRNDVAVKLLTRGSGSGDADKGKQDFLREMQLLSELRHPNIVRFLGACLDMQHMCILFELCPGSLYDLLHKSEDPLPDPPILVKLMREVALGIYYLHAFDPPVLHLDLKSANVLNAANRKDASCAAASGAAACRDAITAKARFVGARPQKA